jgi:hypothetical protein
MRQAVLSVFTGCAMLCAATISMPAAAEAQTVIIINGNQPYYPQPYPYPHRHVVYDVPGYYYGAENGYYNGYNNGYYNSYGDGYYPAYRYGYNRPYWGW